ncbi:MAG: hypothetical protein A2Y38_17360 [Spirochaetes bacterium GWB1_59_5]|nr:MAG: hypothetical protein A2Y38_17360 [Spirochaetes bacterium GWB1_59_5]
MPVIHVNLDGDGAWPDMALEKVIHHTDTFHLSALPDGMKSGTPSCAIRIDLPDGTFVVAQVSAALMVQAVGALRVKFNMPEPGEMFMIAGIRGVIDRIQQRPGLPLLEVQSMLTQLLVKPE